MHYFEPDFNNILEAVYNKKPKRLPFYEHIIDVSIMEKILNKKFSDFYYGAKKEKLEFFKNFISFFIKTGYDTVSFECLISDIMPGSGALYKNKKGAIKNRADFESYPWTEIPDIFFNKYDLDFKLLREAMPEGMKAIGGPGNGIFECTQDIVGLSNLCLIAVDDPQLYRDLFFKVGDTIFLIWERFLKKEYSDVYVIGRFGDDLGYKAATIINPKDIINLLIPQYKRIIKIIHEAGKPFILHSCGNIFSVMEDLIECGIDAKHSNEDTISPFCEWQKRYSKKIAIFGGVDLGFLCTADGKSIKEYVNDILKCSSEFTGFAFGTGNSIPDYIPVENYLKMLETAEIFRNKN